MGIIGTILSILLGIGAAMWLIAAASAEIDRRPERWLYNHPPEDDVCREDRSDE
jgi:hypothetical protein